MPGSVMTIMDYVYLGLIGLAALVFYCHGFFAGVKRSRRVYEALLGSADPEPVPRDETSPEFDAPARQTGIQHPRLPYRGRELRGDFGDN
ncbi:MAG TPA: hypothetical protein VFT34_12155 [Verrucomicrobiae bacterium]|nr:hypothetical protein [Verrucomicrobiae bacterium]